VAGFPVVEGLVVLTAAEGVGGVFDAGRLACPGPASAAAGIRSAATIDAASKLRPASVILFIDSTSVRIAMLLCVCLEQLIGSTGWRMIARPLYSG
jgi:hypothetical protein